MRKQILVLFLLLSKIAFAQTNEVGLTLGGLFPQDNGTAPNAIRLGGGTSYQANYGHRLLGGLTATGLLEAFDWNARHGENAAVCPHLHECDSSQIHSLPLAGNPEGRRRIEGTGFIKAADLMETAYYRNMHEFPPAIFTTLHI